VPIEPWGGGGLFCAGSDCLRIHVGKSKLGLVLNHIQRPY
jgi:hypothetical protein